MITSNLYEKVLLEPATKGGDELFIVSGYASATFARRHITDLYNVKGLNFKLNLIIGMPGKRVDHAAYLQLHSEFKENFQGYYLSETPPVHSKVFSWFTSGQAIEGFSGSANYSQYGFFEDKQVNQMVSDDPCAIKNFFDELVSKSIPITEMEIPDRPLFRLPTIEGSLPPGEIQWIEKGESVRISFLDGKTGETPTASGLNWGQREGRDKDQAYLSIKKDARDEGFLPERGYTFTLQTDDGKSFDCRVHQDDRKSVESTHDNSELGKYLRERIGVGSGVYVTTEMLENYGRTDFTLIKVDDENFILDISV